MFPQQNFYFNLFLKTLKFVLILASVGWIIHMQVHRPILVEADKSDTQALATFSQPVWGGHPVQCRFGLEPPLAGRRC